MMHIVAYFKKLWKFDLKQAWLDYYLINLFRWADKFMANNWFGKKIILLNKKRIYLSINISSNKFLREIIVINVIFLWKYQEAVSHIIRATLHINCHSFVAKLPNVSLLIKYIIEDSLFLK